MKKGDSIIVRDACNFLHTGKVARITPKMLTLTDAAWVADTERYADFLSKGATKEHEGVGKVRIARAAIVQIYPWPKGVALPSGSK